MKMPHVMWDVNRRPAGKIGRVLVLYLSVVFLAGALIATQAGVNSQLARAAGHPVFAAAISFVVGTVALLALSLGVRGSWAGAGALAGLPWWIWTGGLLGAVFVVTTAWLAPVLGAATLLSVAIAGQMTFALLLDHYGLIGLPQRPMSAGRAAGAALLIVGVVMIRRC
jgi:transporter family-2 protein